MVQEVKKLTKQKGFKFEVMLLYFQSKDFVQTLQKDLKELVYE